ncbi:putative membrane protein [Streptohalobacillus salinus]|uniref:Putative membrane protein n=1 Tax=Streptohalobacillus salinus TaxID=621096 RepID=A0A2V3WU08_9BACI|nr:DUF2254 domain-containing protein [Streptohalobacillus salinus]PXW92432.1 putative membrane protein [Streptohalobacillus salinus]
MKKIINQIRTSIWLYPVIYSLIALILSITITIIDKTYAEEMSLYLNSLFYTTTSLAQAVLGIVAGAFITIATFTFSTTMVVLTMYSSQFTPRVVENFLNNNTTMKSFGVFLSGFIYAITSLLFIDTSKEGNLVIAASVAVVYVIVGLIYFLLFVNNVSTHIQASDLILRLQKESKAKIDNYIAFVGESEIISEEDMHQYIDDKIYLRILGHSDGYIQEINYKRLKKFAADNKCVVCVQKVVGQFISKETRVITIYHEMEEEFGEQVLHELTQSILIGNKKTQTQDFSFMIQKIVEIALKALSPGINDPNTANHCLRILGTLLRDLSIIEEGYNLLRDEGNPGAVIYEAYDFEMILYDAYNQIVFYGQADSTVVIEAFKSLSIVKNRASKKNRELIEEYARYIFDNQTVKKLGPLEYRKIEREFNDLMAT